MECSHADCTSSIEISWEYRHRGKVLGVMLDDHARMRVGRNSPEPLRRSQRVGTTNVDGRHQILLVILACVKEIAGYQHRSGFCELDEQHPRSWRMTRSFENSDASIVENVLVFIRCIDFGFFQRLNRRKIDAERGRLALSPGEFSGRDQEGCFGKEANVAGVVLVGMR